MSVAVGNHFVGESWQQLNIEVPYGGTGMTKVKCPNCSASRHKTWERCLRVNFDQAIAKCYNCGDSFAVKEDLQNGYGTVPLHQPVRMKPRRPTYTPAEEFDAASYAAHTWLEKVRGIPRTVSEGAKIEARQVWMYSAKKGEEGGDEWATAFPYFRGEHVVNIKWRTEDKRFRMERGAELCLYGLNDIEESYLIWVEGEIDKLSLLVAGYPSCVSVPNGAPPPTSRDYGAQLAYLESDTSTIMAVRRHVIAVDNDEPGKRLGDELARRLGYANCDVVTWPPDCKDANDTLVKHGPEALERCVERARPYPIEGLYSPADPAVGDALLALYAEGLKGGFSPGDAKLAEYYRVPLGAWTLVTGLAGSGKSEFLNWLSVNLMQSDDWHFAICSPESQPIERHMAQLIQIYQGKPFGEGPTARMTPEELEEGRAWLAEHATFILPSEDKKGSYALDSVLELCRLAILRHGARGVIIDPWNELEHSRPSGMREDEYIGQCLVKIKRFAREYQIHLWLVAHPKGTPRRKDGEGYEVPTLSDVAGGHQWRSQATMGICIHRNHLGDPSKPSEVHIQKVKKREDGKPGVVELWYDPVTGRYNSLGPIERRYASAEPATATEPTAPRRRPAQVRLAETGD